MHFFSKARAGNNSTISVLKLNGCGITDDGIRDISHMLKTNRTLTALYLDYNRISDQGVKLLTNVLTNVNTTISNLSLKGNQSVTDASVDSIINMVDHNPSIKILQLMFCGFTNEGGNRLVELKNISQIDF